MIEDLETGRRLSAEVHLVSQGDLGSIGTGWTLGDWAEHARTYETYKLVATEHPDEILGMMSIVREVGFVEVVLIESTPDNVGRKKRIRGVPGQLLAYAAELSDRIGNDGFVRLVAKTKLIDHYVREYGFERFGSTQIMILNTAAAADLVRTFFEE